MRLDIASVLPARQNPTLAHAEDNERGAGHWQPQQPPMLERYLKEEDRLQKFLAGQAKQHTQGEEKAEGKQMGKDVNNGSSGDGDAERRGRPQAAGNTSLFVPTIGTKDDRSRRDACLP
ncbi:MAG: hypothetical protein Q9184_004012 [Pyrenodesmia sp. 2 TL-2023]